MAKAQIILGELGGTTGFVQKFNFTPSVDGNTKTFTADFNITEAWILSPCASGFYWNYYKAGDTNFYQYYGANATPTNWDKPIANGTAGITFSISGNKFTFNTGNVSNFNVQNLVVLIG